MITNKVVVVALDKRYKRLERDLAGKAQKILLFLKQDGVELEIYLLPSTAMRKLNRQYRGRDTAANVLAYGAPKNFPGTSSRFLGEVYLSPPHIKKRGEDIQSLLAHGILHLIGFNHASRSDRMTMEKVEKEVLAWLNH